MELPGDREGGWRERVGTELVRIRGNRAREDLAKAGEIDEEILLQIERGNFANLSFGQFAEICRRCYGITDPYDFPKGSARTLTGFVHLNRVTPCRAWEGGKGLQWRYFMESLEDAIVRPEFIQLPPRRIKTGEGISEKGRHEGEELLYMISGQVKFHVRDEELGERTFELRSGDIFHFKSGVEHYVENAHSAYAATFLVVRYNPRVARADEAC
jgi:hypothetical protein